MGVTLPIELPITLSGDSTSMGVTLPVTLPLTFNAANELTSLDNTCGESTCGENPCGGGRLAVVATKDGGTLIYKGSTYALEANKELVL